VRKQNIVISFIDILKQVSKRKIGGGHGVVHESIFEEEVEDDDGRWYQFPPNALWNIFLPSLESTWNTNNDDGNNKKGDITSFPYERREVESTLSSYQDAAGAILKYNPQARFRRCSCVNNNGKKFVCIPPKIGWMCTRPAMMVKTSITFERQMTEKRRQQNERNVIDAAVASADRSARRYLGTDEGIVTVRKVAERRAVELAHVANVAAADSAMKVFEDQRQRRKEQVAMSTDDDMEERESDDGSGDLTRTDTDGRSSDDEAEDLSSMEETSSEAQTRKEISPSEDSVQTADESKALEYFDDFIALARTIEELPSMRRVNLKQTSHSSNRDKSVSKTKSKLIIADDDDIREIEAKLREKFIEKEAEERRSTILENNRKMKLIMSGWLGLSMEEVFLEWKQIVKDRKKQRLRDEKKRNKHERLNYEDQLAKLHFAETEVKKWYRQYDHYNDVPYWIHSESGDTLWEEPTIYHYLPSPDWTPPQLPACLINEKTGKMLTPRTIKRNETTTSSPEEINEEDGDPKEKDEEDDSSQVSTTKSTALDIDKLCVSCNTDREVIEAARRLLNRRREIIEKTRAAAEAAAVKETSEMHELETEQNN